MSTFPAQIAGQIYGSDPHFKYRPGHLNTALDSSVFDLPNDPKAIAAMKAAFYGELVAWDPIAQQARWRVKHPFYQNGGVLATGGGLVFQGTADGMLYGYDAVSGKQLWSYATTNGILAPPISYSLDGLQYVAVMVGAGGFGAMTGTISPDRPRLPGRLLVFALDGKAKAPAFDIPPQVTPDLTGVTTSGDVTAGLAAYNDTCLVCHGFGAAGRFTADLRRSEIVKNREAFESVVLGGALASQGMVSFAKYLTPKDAENVRSYIISRARQITPPDKGGLKPAAVVSARP